MGTADLGIGAAGSSSFERCCLGLPSLVVVAADNQRDIAAALVQSGAAEAVRIKDDLPRRGDALRRLCAEPQARVAMAQAAANLCDGGGTGRVAAELFSPARA